MPATPLPVLPPAPARPHVTRHVRGWSYDELATFILILADEHPAVEPAAIIAAVQAAARRQPHAGSPVVLLDDVRIALRAQAAPRVRHRGR